MHSPGGTTRSSHCISLSPSSDTDADYQQNPSGSVQYRINSINYRLYSTNRSLDGICYTAANLQQRVCCCGPMLGQTGGRIPVRCCSVVSQLSTSYGVKSVLPDVPAGGVASVEQMERQLPRTAKDHFCKSCKSDEILEG